METQLTLARALKKGGHYCLMKLQAQLNLGVQE